MTGTAPKLNIALLTVPEVTASVVYGMYDLFASAGRDWDFLVTGTPGVPRVRPVLVAADTAAFQAANGIWIRPQAGLDVEALPDVVCVPEVRVAPDEELDGRYGPETAWLRECHAAGATIASACSGALLLAEAGLLHGLDVTTHWGYCDALARRCPTVRVHPQRALIAGGTGERIVTAGGGTSWHDLALFLVARFLGAEEAMRLARIYLIDWHDMGQQPFATLTRARQADDAAIAACQRWVAEHYDEDRPVMTMQEMSGIPERSFKRRFTRATGMSPLEYVHTLRLEEARQLLETSGMAVKAVANEVGYEDTSFFSRLFRRKVGLTPAQYRKRFGAMRRVLKGGSA